MRSLGAAAVAATLLLPRTALAQFDDAPAVEATVEGQSAQHFAFEFRVGPYVPAIDSEFGGTATPYRNVFGDQVPLLFAMELDWQMLRLPFASLGVGLSLGYERVAAKSAFTGGTTPSDEETALSLLPLAAHAVLRIDGLAAHAHIPLVPYAKAGLDFVPWWVTNGAGGAVCRTDSPGPCPFGETGMGYALGFHVAGGLMVRLDDLEPSAARNLDHDAGINHSYVFAEILWNVLSLRTASMDLSALTWVAGLALEF